MNDKLQQIDTLLGELNQYRANENYRITGALEIEYTYDSNRIEGNTLTLHETDMVVNKGITIAGKGLREHLEAIPCTRLYWRLRCTRNWCLFIPLLTGMAGQPVY